MIRRKLNVKFSESEHLEFFYRFIESLREPVILLEEKYKIRTVNSNFLNKFHLRKKEIEGKSILDIAEGKWNSKKLVSAIEEVEQTGGSISNILVTKTFKKAGKFILLLNITSIVSPLTDEKLVLVTMEDITETRQLASNLAETKNWLQTIVDNSSAVIYAKDIKGRYILFNKKCEDISKLRREDVIGRTDYELWPRDIADDYTENDKKVLKYHKPIQLEEKGVFLGKPKLVLLTTKFPLFNSAGVLYAVCGIASDITYRVELDRRKDEFISIASHELKTPLTTIKGYTQILEKHIEKSDSTAKYLVGKMNDQIDRITTIINDLLDVSKIEAGKLEYNYELFDINDLVGSIVNDFQLITKNHVLIKKGVAIDLIHGDRDRIGQVLINFISNALKYSPKDTDVIISITQKEKDSVVISVQDFGIGIAKRKQPHVFDRFFRVQEGGKIFPSGFGLGLYISAEIIKRHNGKIWVESESGKGSTFYFSIPLSQKLK